MAVGRGSEQVRRHELFESMRSVHGERPAETLMELLPPVGWGDVATREHVSHQTALLHSEMATQRSDLKAQIAAVRSDLKAEIAVLRTEMTEMGAALGAKIDAQSVAMHKQGKELSDALRKQTFTVFGAMVALWVGTIAALAAVR